MAEAAGLAFGTVALVGLFKQCVELFGYISASRSLGRDYELLKTKLDVEKTLLLQWADRMRLLGSDYDTRLEERTIKDIIRRVLSSIQLLLSDSESLRDKYGVRSQELRPEDIREMSDHSPSINRSAFGQPERVLSENRLSQFITKFNVMTLRQNPLAKPMTMPSKVRWAVHDKEKFEALIGQLSHFISKLNEIVPDNNGLATSMTRDDLQQLHMDRLKIILEAAADHEPLMASSTEHVIRERCERRVLQGFWFRAMDDRRLNVANAHARTFRWALETPNEGTEIEWDNLSSWLAESSGIYWISGKAGSGKSTLMKYLYHAEKTKSLLRRWAGTSSLVMANFFFYALGTHEQKSHKGLVMALLYQILKSEPSLIPSLFPNMWQEALTSEHVDVKPPSEGELKTAFSAIQNGIGKPLKFCFFIDGLDEYSGNYLHGISLVESLATNPDIKIIVSSRPIPACVQTFSDRPQLKLQELTKGDIAKYISDTISSHQYMRRMARLAPDQAASISDQILSKASGVFLWVVLACRSLIEGFAAYDNVSELRRRVDELPPELEDLFQHMLGKIEPRYQSHAAKILRICYENHLAGAERLSTIGLAILDERGLDARKASLPGQFPDTEKHGKCEVLEGRVRSRCLGLVEILRSRSELSKEHCFCNATKPEDKHDNLVDSQVTFIHRTVFDYLSQPGVWNLRCLSIDDPLFNPNATLSCIYLQLLGLSAVYKMPRRRNRTYLRHTLIHASRADSSASELIMPVLMTLEPLLRKLLAENPPYFPLREQLLNYSSDLWDSFKENFPFALLLAVESGMINAVQSLETHVEFPPSLSSTLLLHATCLPYSTALSPQPLDVSSEMVRYLLSSGNNPNGEFSEGLNKTKKTSPWKYWLSEIDQHILKSGALQTANVTMAFIQAGADVTVDTAETGDNLLTSMRRHFIHPHNVGNLLPEERWALRQKGLNIIGMIEERRASKAGTNPCHPASHPPVAGTSDRAQTGPKRPMESESMEHAKRLKFT